MKYFDRFLKRMNKYSGNRFWILVSIFGIILGISYFLFILPFLGIEFNLHFLGYFSDYPNPKIIAYAGLFSIKSDWYYIIIMFGIVLPWIGLIIHETGKYYYKGFSYIKKGVWRKKQEDKLYFKKNNLLN